MKATSKCYIGNHTFGEDCMEYNCCGKTDKGLPMYQARLNHELSNPAIDDQGQKNRIKKINRSIYYFKNGK